MSHHTLLARLLPVLGEASASPGKVVELGFNNKEEVEDTQHLITGLRDLSNCFNYETKIKGTNLHIKAVENESNL